VKELGRIRLDGSIALRAGLLHDTGKAVTSEVDGQHTLVESEATKRCDEDPIIVNAIAAHHDKAPCSSVNELSPI